ncbi:MAG: ABC transporter ATP-binding protein [Chloroflexota bacterium]
MSPIIQLENVRRSLPLGNRTIHILHDINFSVRAGEWVTVSGPSGSGKSTLLGLVGAIDQPNEGKVVLDGTDISRLPESQLAHIRNEKVGIVFQSFNLIATMTAQQNVEVPLYIGPRRYKARALAKRMLEMVGLGDRLHHLPGQLSGGQQQRVAIARALVNQPRILLADEPTGNLDSGTSEQVMDLIERLQQQLELTVVMVTHDPLIASRADKVLQLVDGRFVSHNGATAPPAISKEVAR